MPFTFLPPCACCACPVLFSPKGFLCLHCFHAIARILPTSSLITIGNPSSFTHEPMPLNAHAIDMPMWHVAYDCTILQAIAYDDDPACVATCSQIAALPSRAGPSLGDPRFTDDNHHRGRRIDPTAVLPEEILLLIAREVGHARLKTRRQDLLALACTCRRLRKCATRALWEHLEVAITPVAFKYEPGVPIPTGPSDLHFAVMPRGRPFPPAEAALRLKTAWLRSLTMHDPHSRAELQAVRAGNSLVKFFAALGVPPYLRRIELQMDLNFDLRSMFTAPLPESDFQLPPSPPFAGRSVLPPASIASNLTSLTCMSPTFLLLANGPHQPRLEFPNLRFLTVMAPTRTTTGTFGEAHVPLLGPQGTLQDLPNLPKLASLVLPADVDVSERVLHHLLFLAASRLDLLAVYPTELAAHPEWLRTSTLPSSLPRIRVLHTNQVLWNLVIGHIRAPRLTHLAITSAPTPLTDPELHRVGHLTPAHTVQSYVSNLTAIRLRGNAAELFLNKDQVLALATLPHLTVLDASLEILGPEPVHAPIDTHHVPFPSLVQLGSNAPLAAWVGAWPFPKLQHLRISGMASRVICATSTIHIPVLGWRTWRRLEISPEDGARVVVDRLRFTAHMEVILVNAAGVWLPPSLTLGPMTRLSLPAVTLTAMREIRVHPPGSAIRNLTISGGPPWGIAQVLAPSQVRTREVHVFWSNIPDLPALEWLSRMPGLRVVQLHGERSSLPFSASGCSETAQSLSLASLRNADSRWIKMTWWSPRMDQETVNQNLVWDELLKYPPIPGGISHIEVCIASPNDPPPSSSPSSIDAIAMDLPSTSPVPPHALVSRLLDWCTHGIELSPSPQPHPPESPHPTAVTFPGDHRSVSQCISVISSTDELLDFDADPCTPDARGQLAPCSDQHACWSSLVESVHRAHVRFQVVLGKSQQALVDVVSRELEEALRLYREGAGKAVVDMCICVG